MQTSHPILAWQSDMGMGLLGLAMVGANFRIQRAKSTRRGSMGSSDLRGSLPSCRYRTSLQHFAVSCTLFHGAKLDLDRDAGSRCLFLQAY
jgi:hypothetical protein